MHRATLGLLVKGDQALLGLKKTGEIGVGTVNGPGGKYRDDQEDAFSCLIRETREEFGIELIPNRMRGLGVLRVYKDSELTWAVDLIWCDAWEGKARDTPDMLPIWCTFPEGIPYKMMLPGDDIWFFWALAGYSFDPYVYLDSNGKLIEVVLDPKPRFAANS